MIRQVGRGKAAYLLIIKVLLILSGLFLTNHTVLKRLEYFLEWNFYFSLVVFLGILPSTSILNDGSCSTKYPAPVAAKLTHTLLEAADGIHTSPAGS